MEVWEKHDILFHYTTGDGVRGILESQTLHATHYKYLNDTNEMMPLATRLKEIAMPSVIEAVAGQASKNARWAELIKRRGGIDAIVESEVRTMIDVLYRVTFGVEREHKFFQPYLVCFCHHASGSFERGNGLLSQWRAYGRDAGYAIVFDVKKLIQLLREEDALHFYGYGGLGDVVYADDPDEFKSEFKELIKLVGEHFPKLALGHAANLEELYSPFANAASRYKHQAFKEEKEVRLCLSPLDKGLVDPKSLGYDKKTEKRVCYKSGFVPYIKVFEKVGKRLPVTQIIVGPHIEKHIRREKLAKYIELNKLEIEVVCSETPLI
ncbi:MAG: DUF2971 domain-containing protein [Bacteroidota bacterium]